MSSGKADAPAVQASEGHPREAERQALPSFALDLMGIAVDPPEGFGAEIAVQWFPARAASWLSLRTGVGVRFGNIDRLDASDSRSPTTFKSTTALASAGLVAHPWRASARNPFGCAVRADWWFVYEWVSDPSTDGATPVTSNPINTGPDVVADVSWLLTRNVEAAGGIGAEYELAAVEVLSNGRQAAAFRGPSQWRGLLEAGLRIRF
jgi:hypothetical protein